MNKKVNKNVLMVAVVIAGAIVVAAKIGADVASQYSIKSLELEGKRIQDQAAYECGLATQATWEDKETGAVITVPYEGAYNDCMAKKGY